MTRSTRSSAASSSSSLLSSSVLQQHQPSMASTVEQAPVDMQLRSGAKRKAMIRAVSAPNAAAAAATASNIAGIVTAASTRAAQEQLVVAAYERTLRSGRSRSKAMTIQSNLQSMADEIESIAADAAMNADDAKTSNDNVATEETAIATDKENVPAPLAKASSKRSSKGGVKSDRLSKLVASVQSVTMELEAELKALSPAHATSTDAPAQAAAFAPMVTAANVNTNLFASNAPLTLSPRTLLVPSAVAIAAIPSMELNASSNPATPEQSSSENTLAVPAAATQTHSPQLMPPVVPELKADRASNLGRPYVTINPDLLRDAAWGFKDLQELCVRLGLGGRGKRETLVQRLVEWHRVDFNARGAAKARNEEDDHPLSIRKRMKNAANFAMLPVDTPKMLRTGSMPLPSPQPAPAAAAAAAAAGPVTTLSIDTSSGNFPLSPENDGHANGNLSCVSVAHSLPQLLTPLLYKTARRAIDGTPKSILASPCPRMSPEGNTLSETAKRLAFSVFNGVKLIPHREDERRLQELNSPQSPTKTLAFDGEQQQQQRQHKQEDSDACIFEEAEEGEISFELAEQARVQNERRVQLQQQQEQQQQEQMMWEEKAREDAAGASSSSSSSSSVAASAEPRASFLNSVSEAIRKVLSPRKSITPSLGLSRAAGVAASAAAASNAPLQPQQPLLPSTAHFSFDTIPERNAHNESYEQDSMMDS